MLKIWKQITKNKEFLAYKYNAELQWMQREEIN